MAKTSMIVANNRRKKLIEKYRERRNELRARSLNVNLSEDERDAARRQLGRLPKNSNPIRYKNRCALSGRPQGFLRKFGLSRIAVRDLALKGELPGVRKASW